MVRPDTLSGVLFQRLTDDLIPHPSYLRGLGKRIVTLPDEGALAKVTGVDYTQHTISFVPRQDLQTGKKLPKNDQVERTVKPIQIDTPYESSRAIVRTQVPEKIAFMVHDKPVVNFVPDDPELDSYLERALERFPFITDPFDLKTLTLWVHAFVRHNPKPFDSPLDGELSVGEYLRQYGGVCRHSSAVEFAVLRLRRVEAHPVNMTMHRPSGELFEIDGQKTPLSGHLHLEVRLDQKLGIGGIIADPSFNFSGTEREFREQLLAEDYDYTERVNWGLSGVWK